MDQGCGILSGGPINQATGKRTATHARRPCREQRYAGTSDAAFGRSLLATFGAVVWCFRCTGTWLLEPPAALEAKQRLHRSYQQRCRAAIRSRQHRADITANLHHRDAAHIPSPPVRRRSGATGSGAMWSDCGEKLPLIVPPTTFGGALAPNGKKAGEPARTSLHGNPFARAIQRAHETAGPRDVMRPVRPRTTHRKRNRAHETQRHGRRRTA